RVRRCEHISATHARAVDPALCHVELGGDRRSLLAAGACRPWLFALCDTAPIVDCRRQTEVDRPLPDCDRRRDSLTIYLGVRQPVPFGKYLLLDRISVGGMAEVFKAKSYGVEGFEKIIAIKRILPTMGEDRDFIKMFIDEAKIAGQLAHANICQIFELGRIDGSHFI